MRYPGECMDIFHILRGMCILLIDDDEWIRDSLCIFFESEGCHIVALETAEEGLNALADQRFDIIIADYKLPGMNGIEFISKIDRHCPDAVKVLITAYPTETVEQRAIQAGVRKIVAKPFTAGIILDCLAEVLSTEGT